MDDDDIFHYFEFEKINSPAPDNELNVRVFFPTQEWKKQTFAVSSFRSAPLKHRVYDPPTRQCARFVVLVTKSFPLR